MNRAPWATLAAGAAAALILAGCVPPPLTPEMGSQKWGADITWHGQSCFTIQDSVHRTVVIDPFDETVGYGRILLFADALLITHRHFDHAFKSGVRPRAREIEVVESTGTSTVAAGLVVNGIDSDHDKEGGEVYGRNTMYTFTIGGLRCAHLGDLGQLKLNDFQREMLGKVDVLFIPIGGVTTLDPKEAKAVVDALKPGVVFPMHYGDIRFYRLAPLNDFLKLFPENQVHVHKDSTVRIRVDDLGPEPHVHVLQPTPKNL